LRAFSPACAPLPRAFELFVFLVSDGRERLLSFHIARKIDKSSILKRPGLVKNLRGKVVQLLELKTN
jgi:hypothetical protein